MKEVHKPCLGQADGGDQASAGGAESVCVARLGSEIGSSREIAAGKGRGEAGLHRNAKMNSLTDKRIIEKLVEASQGWCGD